VRDLTHTFIKRSELLPPGETLEQHTKWQKEHADSVSRDRASLPGLWKGLFKMRPQPRRPLRDAEDGVDRCPYCQWELEDGMCQRCGLPFDDNGTGTWDFSDMDETSELDLTSEHDLDIEVDMDDEDEDAMVEDDDGHDGSLMDEFDWYDEYGRAHPYAIRRFLQGPGLPTQYIANPRARHSAAGGRRRSYAASIASEIPESEMAVVEEEDEEEEEDGDEDSSMNDFIDDDEMAGADESTSSRASRTIVMHPEEDDEDESTEDEGPIRSGRSRLHGIQSRASTTTSRPQPRTHTSAPPRTVFRRNRQESRYETAETPSVASVASSIIEEDDDEDEGPIPPGRRRYRAPPRQESSMARGSSASSSPAARREPSSELREPSSPVARREPSVELGEFPANLGYTPLGRALDDHEVDEVDEVDEGDDSDGGRTTVGWEPITISDNRIRNAGSLTPTADRPNPPDRPLSRTGSATFPLGTRGIRRRSSVLSASTAHYEDNDAEDEVSDGDPDSDVDMNTPAQHQESSHIQLRSTTPRPTVAQNVHQQAQPFSDSFDIDSDDTDISSLPQRRGQQIRRQEEYNPRISLLFAQHMTDLRNVDHPVTPSDIEQLRAMDRTPLARPRSSIRNRTPVYGGGPPQGVHVASPGHISRSSQTMQNSPRARNTMETSTGAAVLLNPRSPADRSFASSGRTLMNDISPRLSAGSNRENPNSLARGPPVPSSPTAGSRSLPQSVGQTASPGSAPHPGHSIERPSRPPSTTGRRVAAWPPFAAPQFTPMGPGLNTVRAWQTLNPFWGNPAAVRPRQSTQRLRDQASTATLRSQNSRILRTQPSQVNVRETNSSSPQMRPQASRIHLRSQPSTRRLQNQASMRALRAAEAALRAESSQFAVAGGGSVAANSAPPRRYSNSPSDNNLSDRATELVNRRAQELGNRNPFARRYGQNIHGGAASVGILSNQNQTQVTPPARANTMPTTSVSSSAHSGASTGQSQIQHPIIRQRRSNRALAHTQATQMNATGSFVPASSLQNGGGGLGLHNRTRSNHSNGSVSSHDSSFSTASRPITAGGDQRRN
jgi:hypothetical protein